MISQFPPHLCPKPAQTGILEGSFTTSQTSQSKKQNLALATNHLVGYKELKYVWKKSQENFNVQESNKK
jgi:hypothetical protein